MALDSVSLPMIAPHLGGATVLCLGYPDYPGGRDTLDEFRRAGAVAVHVVDVIAHRGFERIVDLNESPVWPQRYGLVINPGTLEHCFNLGQAWANAWDAVNVDGRIMHIAPATMLNHGFWNVCPIAVRDWCEANGGAVESERFAINGTGERVSPWRITTSGSGRGALPPETVYYALCRKTSDVARRWPAQGCYRR